MQSDQMNKLPPVEKKDITRKVLLMITGTTLELVTETVFALMCDKDHFIPNEIHVITTLDGKNLLKTKKTVEKKRDLLFYLNQLCSEYPEYFNDTRFEFSEHSFETEENDPKKNFFIHVIGEAEGSACSDIRTSSDSEKAADTITNVIKELCEDKDIELRVSIAGGRKTMGFYAGYVLSIYGNNKLNLYHVLANELFESKGKSIDKENPPSHEYEYFYPTKKEMQEAQKKGTPIIEIATIPILHLRSLLDSSVYNIPSYSSLVSRVQNQISKYKLAFNIDTVKGETKLFLYNVKEKIFELKLEPKKATLFLTLLKGYVENGYKEFALDFKHINSYIKIFNFIYNANKNSTKIAREQIYRTYNEIDKIQIIEEKKDGSGIINKDTKGYFGVTSELKKQLFLAKLERGGNKEEKKQSCVNCIKDFISNNEIIKDELESNVTIPEIKNYMILAFSLYINGSLPKLHEDFEKNHTYNLLPYEIETLLPICGNKDNINKDVVDKVIKYCFKPQLKDIEIDYDSLKGIIKEPQNI